MKHSTIFTSQLQKKIYFFTAIAIAIYLVLRAVHIPLVHDEAATFFHYIHSLDFIPYIAHWDANNHILNSALASLFYVLLGPEEWVLRLPNLLAFPFYAWFIFQLGTFIRQKWIQASFRFVMLMTHGVLEFFALSRGYGMSIAAMVGGLYLLMLFQQTAKLKHLIASLLAWNLAVLANLNLSASYFLSLGWLLLLILFYPQKNRSIKLLIAFIGFFSMGFFVLLALELKKRGLLYYGASDGFWEITVQTLIRMFFGFTHPILSVLIIFFSCLTFFSLIYFLIIHQINQWFVYTHMVWPVFFTANLAAIFIQNKLMHVNFPEDRTGMHMFVFLTGSIFFIADWLNQLFKYSRYFILPLLLIPIHMLTYMNLGYSTQWKKEHMDEKLFHTILRDAGSMKKLPSVGGYGIQHLIWYYYVYRYGGNAPLMSYNDYPAFHYDYLLLNQEHRNLSGLKNYTFLDEDAYSKIGLYKRKEHVFLMPDTSWITNDFINVSYEFIDFFNAKTKRYMGDSLAIEISCNLVSKQKPLIAYMVTSVDNPEGGTKYYIYASLHWMRNSYTTENGQFHQIFYIPRMPEKPTRLAIYFWNFKKKIFSLTNINVTIYRIREFNYTSISSNVGQ
ncbi:MAG: hypothetical protein N2167_04485 [Flavobacteriales bacterium]|nr:hypothetical protein [Flavobacteriales bacterium]